MMADNRGCLPLHRAAHYGNADAARLLLAAAPQAARAAVVDGMLPLHCVVSYWGDATQVSASAAAEIVQLLLRAAPRRPWHQTSLAYLPLQWAAAGGRKAIVRALLATAAHAAMAATRSGRVPLHYASSEAAAQLLAAAAPATPMVRDADGRLPIAVQLEGGYVEAARAALPATETHGALAAIAAAGEAAVPLFADVACQRPLSSADWQLVPIPCVVLGAALPAGEAAAAG